MKKTLLFALLLLGMLGAGAQEEGEEKKGFKKENLFFGGNFGLSIGTYTLINISPQVGYRFNKVLSAGLGINGQYVSQPVYYTTGAEAGTDKRGVVGLNLFGQVRPIDQFLIHVQPEANYIWGSRTYNTGNPSTFKLDTEIVPSLLAGGGLVLPAGGGSMVVTVLFDLLQRPNSPYSNRPIYNVGYYFGF